MIHFLPALIGPHDRTLHQFDIYHLDTGLLRRFSNQNRNQAIKNPA
jgi:hypothetical protein